MKQCFFAVDLGATSGRTILGTFSSHGVELEEVNRFANPLIEVGGHVYWDIHALYLHLIEGLRSASARTDLEVISIGIDTWGVDFVCIGTDGQMLRQPYSYRDPHTTDAPETFFSRIAPGKVYQLTGIQVISFNSLFQLDAMRRHHDSALEVADKILFMPDALSFLLTGQMVTEYTIASTSQLLNARTRCMEPSLLAAVGLTEKNFARLVYPKEQVGVLTKEVQLITGLPPLPVIAVGGHDTASAVAAIPALNANFAYLSSGTWSLMGIEVDAPIITPETEALNFTNEGGVSGNIRLLKNICGLWLLERCRIVWGETSYDELIVQAEKSQPFRSRIHPDDERFVHPADMVEAIRSYCQESRQPVPETQGEIVRCIFESLAMRYAEVLKSLRALSPHPIEVLHIIGGGSRNDLLNQLTANATGIPVIAGPAEATAIGNVMVQAIAAGKASNIAAMRRLVNHSVELKTYFPEQ